MKAHCWYCGPTMFGGRDKVLCRGTDLQRRSEKGNLINKTRERELSIPDITISDIPLRFVRFDSSTFIFTEALPLLNTPKFGGGSIYARLTK
jgi:hypothetical protein